MSATPTGTAPDPDPRGGRPAVLREDTLPGIPGRQQDVTAVPAGAPSGFVARTTEYRFTAEADRMAVWNWLNDPATFVDSQVWPWRVEFVGGGFEPGVLNCHYGPFMVFAATVGEIRPGFYRDLRYYYGSYAVSFRLIRPVRLQFLLDDVPGGGAGRGGTEVRIVVDALVRRPLAPLWTRAITLFWGRFATWLRRSVVD